MTLDLPDESATLAFASRLFPLLSPGTVVFLHGNLGAGKTTLVRGCLRAAGHTGKVKSPTFTLVEEYRLAGLFLFHFDLYRLADAEELEYIGVRDYLRPDSLCFIEWPEKGAGVLPNPDLDLCLHIRGAARTLEIRAFSPLGEGVLARLRKVQA